MSIEQTLASMAHRQLTQNMPSMAPNLLGFEIITSSEDNTFALGVNVAMIGDTYVFIPTILKNGRIAPVDLMYVPEMDQFLPCKDAWITYLQSKKADLLATLSKKKRGGNAGKVDLDMPFTNITKVASSNLPELQDYAKEAMVDALCNAPADTGIPCLEELVDMASVNGLRKLASYIESTEGRDGLVEFYSDEELRRIANKLDDKLTKAVVSRPMGSNGEVKILTSASTEARSLSNDDKVKILRDGAVIKDSRGLTPSTVFKTKTNAEWCTPNEHGVYELLKIDGTTMTAYVLNGTKLSSSWGHPATEAYGRQPDPVYYVIPLDDGQRRVAYKVKNKHLVAQPYAGVKNITLSGSAITSIAQETSAEVIIMDSKGSAQRFDLCTSANNVPVIRKDDEYIIQRAINSASCGRDRVKPLIGSSAEKARGLDGIIVGRKGAKMRVANNYLRVGSDAFYMPIMNTWNDEFPKNIRMLATVDSILDAISRRNDHVAIEMFKADNGVYIESDIVKVAHASDIDAAYALVSKLAIAPEDAMEMIKEASAKQGEINDYLVKIAADSQVAMAFSELPADEYQNDTQTLSPMSNMSAEDKNILNKAIQAGTKEVFDISILRILAEEDAPAQIINEWMPSLFTALDKVGRILYLCRAGESMQDAYGVDRVEDVERKLRKQFNELGDIILTMLKGKVKDIDDLLNGEM